MVTADGELSLQAIHTTNRVVPLLASAADVWTRVSGRYGDARTSRGQNAACYRPTHFLNNHSASVQQRLYTAHLYCGGGGGSQPREGAAWRIAFFRWLLRVSGEWMLAP